MSDTAVGFWFGALVASAVIGLVFFLKYASDYKYTNEKLVISYYNKSGTYDRTVVKDVTEGRYDSVWPKFKCQKYVMNKHEYTIELSNPND